LTDGQPLLVFTPKDRMRILGWMASIVLLGCLVNTTNGSSLQEQNDAWKEHEGLYDETFDSCNPEKKTINEEEILQYVLYLEDILSDLTPIHESDLKLLNELEELKIHKSDLDQLNKLENAKDKSSASSQDIQRKIEEQTLKIAKQKEFLDKVTKRLRQQVKYHLNLKLKKNKII